MSETIEEPMIMPGQLFNHVRRQRIVRTRSRLVGTITTGVLLTLISNHGWQPVIAESRILAHAEESAEPEAAEIEAVEIEAAEPESTDSVAPPALNIESVQIAPITIINTGSEPRQVLQLTPAVDTVQQSVMTLDMGGTMTSSGITQTLPDTPTTQMVMETDVTQIDESGNRYIDFEYTDVTVGEAPGLPPEAIAAMRSQLSQLEGLAGSWVINEQGYLSQFTMTPPESMSGVMGQGLQQMVDSLQQMSAPFPSDAIGIGAQWQMPYSASMNGIDMSGLATYELVSLEGDRVTLNTMITQQGTTTTNPTGLGLPESVDLGVQQIESSGQGIIEMDLNAVMPIYSDMSLTSDSQFTVGLQGMEIPVSMNMLVNMSLISE